MIRRIRIARPGAAALRTRPPPFHVHSSTRAFSSSSPNHEGLPPIGARAYFKRMLERRSTYVDNKKNGVFSPDMSSLKSWLLFGVVQLPNETAVDLPEFLDGAKRAVASVLQATSSREFTTFVTAKEDEAPASENAQLLRQWCTPICYDMMVDNVRHSFARQRIFEIEHVDVEQIFLTMSRYDRVSEAEQRDDAKLAQQVLMQRPWSDDATVERLQLNVGFVTTERTRQTLLDQKKVRVVDAKWYYQAALLSDVTRPDAVDWRVAAIVAERGLGQTRISEEDLVEDQPAEQNPEEPAEQSDEEPGASP